MGDAKNKGFFIVSNEIYNSRRKLVNTILKNVKNLKSEYCKLNKTWKFTGESRKFNNKIFCQYDVIVTKINKKRFVYKFVSL